MLGIRGLGVALSLGICVVVASACAKQTSSTYLQDADLKLSDGQVAPFDRNTIVDTASFVDVESIDLTIIQGFLHKNAYDHSSFLETYQSNGLSAAAAIANAASTYQINPLVFLVELEATQGLIGAQDYPFPPERVEYVFRCGCLTADNCLPELAGIDRQIDCLGRSLRTALNKIAMSEVTAAGWGKDQTSTTLDNVKVTPTTEATAAVYDHTPYVDEGAAGGAWLFWNLWNVYGTAINYAGPIGGAGAGGWIGDVCTTTAACGFANATCATNYPGGLCTTSCKGDCPSQPDKPDSFCTDFPNNGGFCLAVCNPVASACRTGYVCSRLQRFGATTTSDSQYVCTLP